MKSPKLAGKEQDMAKYEEGDFIKVEFKDEGTGIDEWMWVRVHHSDEDKRLVFGTLDSMPLNSHGSKLKVGTELAISFAQIRDHRKSSDFDSSK